jgi:hypothetical protein
MRGVLALMERVGRIKGGPNPDLDTHASSTGDQTRLLMVERVFAMLLVRPAPTPSLSDEHSPRRGPYPPGAYVVIVADGCLIVQDGSRVPHRVLWTCTTTTRPAKLRHRDALPGRARELETSASEIVRALLDQVEADPVWPTAWPRPSAGDSASPMSTLWPTPAGRLEGRRRPPPAGIATVRTCVCAARDSPARSGPRVGDLVPALYGL